MISKPSEFFSGDESSGAVEGELLVPFGDMFDVPSSDVDSSIGETALIGAMTTVELATAQAQAKAGLIPAQSAAAISDALFENEPPLSDIANSMADSATPVPALVRWIRELVGEPHAQYVHLGLTSQDVVDTALNRVQSGVISESLIPLVTESFAALVRYAQQYADTPLLGRTLGQAALPITFGLKVCRWLGGLEAAGAELSLTRSQLAVQIGGPVGDLRGFGPKAQQIVAEIADTLELYPPRQAWHTQRAGVLTAATSYVLAINACAKVATDVLAMLAPEVGELRLGNDPQQADRGGSSAMPHKRNPAAAVLIRSAAVQAPGLLATIAAAGVQEHERAAGAWQAEWRPLRELIHLCGGALLELALLVQDLIVVPEAMAENLKRADVGDDTGASAARVHEFLARYKES